MRNSSLYVPSVNDREAIDHLQRILLHVDCLSGAYYPTSSTDQERPVSYDHGSYGELPVPPREFWHWYGNNEDEYLSGGRRQAAAFRETAIKYGFIFEKGKRMLDFGCSGGRVTRWFVDEARKGVNVMGCDIDAASIEWCQKNLMPPMSFFTNNTNPHLPVRDGFFDFIFAGSVFTHIKDMSAAWALELARCLSADGLAIYTVTTELSIDTLRKVAAADTQKTKKVPQFVVDNNIDAEHLRKRGFITTQTSPWWLATLYHTEFFRRRLEIAYDVVAVVPSLKGYQTGFVVRLRRDYYSQ